MMKKQNILLNVCRSYNLFIVKFSSLLPSRQSFGAGGTEEGCNTVFCVIRRGW